MVSKFISLNISKTELRCAATFENGQCFGWNKHKDKNEWTGVLDQSIFTFKETESDTLFRPEMALDSSGLEKVKDFLLLGFKFPLEPKADTLEDMYSLWGQRDTIGRFSHIAARHSGCRLLRQDPVECLFSFICSSNNNIPRINLMLDRLRRKYGKCIGTVNQIEYFTFPSVEELALASENELRSLGMGYRAKFIVGTAQQIEKLGGSSFLLQLRHEPYDKVVETLISFPGIGPKVADCIALFAFDCFSSIPVDTHVWQIAHRDYKFNEHSKVKSMTKKKYQAVGDLFRGVFGEYAGWAHTILFSAELPRFKNILKKDGFDMQNIAKVKRRRKS